MNAMGRNNLDQIPTTTRQKDRSALILNQRPNSVIQRTLTNDLLMENFLDLLILFCLVKSLKARSASQNDPRSPLALHGHDNQYNELHHPSLEPSQNRITVKKGIQQLKAKTECRRSLRLLATQLATPPYNPRHIDSNEQIMSLVLHRANRYHQPVMNMITL